MPVNKIEVKVCGDHIELSSPVSLEDLLKAAWSSRDLQNIIGCAGCELLRTNPVWALRPIQPKRASMGGEKRVVIVHCAGLGPQGKKQALCRK